jgi:hypothetical protein
MLYAPTKKGVKMKIYKTMMSISDDPAGGGNIYKMDTIEHEGQMWLVPEWLEKEGEGWKKPCLSV